MSYLVCPVCHGRVSPKPYSREDVSAVLARHIRQIHPTTESKEENSE